MASSRIELKSSHRRAPAAATRIGPTSPQKTISVSITVRRKKPLNLAELQGRRLSHEEFNEQYAADPVDFERIRTFAKNHGLTVDESASSLARRTIVLHGTASNLEQAFGVTLHDYEGDKHHRRFHCFEGAITVPAEIADSVEAVLGLDARPVAQPHFRVLDPATQATAQPLSAPQVAQLYSFPTNLDGTGQTIGILELGGGYSDSDLRTYFQGLGLSVPTVVSVSVDGGTNSPGDPSGADGEVDLDIQVAGALAPKAKIAVYFAPNSDQGFIDAITTAVHDTANKPSVLSIS